MMKKVLFYTSAALLLLLSFSIGFTYNSEMIIMSISAAILCLVLSAALGVMDHSCIWYLPVYALILCIHAVYLFIGASFTVPLIYIVAGLFFLVCCSLYLALKKHADPRVLLNIAFLMKIALLPELFLNYMISQASGQFDFILFSYLLLLISSAYAWAAFFHFYKAKFISKAVFLICSLLQLCFITDLLAVLYMEIVILSLSNKGLLIWPQNAGSKAAAQGESVEFIKGPKPEKNRSKPVKNTFSKKSRRK